MERPRNPRNERNPPRQQNPAPPRQRRKRSAQRPRAVKSQGARPLLSLKPKVKRFSQRSVLARGFCRCTPIFTCKQKL